MKNSTVDFSEIVAAPILIRGEEWPERNEPSNTHEEDADIMLPRRDRWPELLGLDECGAIEEILHGALLAPIAEVRSLRSKRIRSQLLACSYRLLSGEAAPSAAEMTRCRLAGEAVELIHAGSLIVDDIEDGSPVRRGRPALHLRYPAPVALNAGNWLYFWPFDLFKKLELSNDQLRQIYEFCHRTLLRAHFGQAIDLGAKLDTLAQAQVKEVCLAALRLKTGALMGFAALLGAAVAGASDPLLSIFDDFGRDLGVALQMFNDLGNAAGRSEQAKRYEDLMLSRPSWVWACAAAGSDPGEYQEFLAAVKRLPDATDLEIWMTEHETLDQTRRSARQHLELGFERFAKRLTDAGAHWSRRAFDDLHDLGEEIALAYE